MKKILTLTLCLLFIAFGVYASGIGGGGIGDDGIDGAGISDDGIIDTISDPGDSPISPNFTFEDTGGHTFIDTGGHTFIDY